MRGRLALFMEQGSVREIDSAGERKNRITELWRKRIKEQISGRSRHVRSFLSLENETPSTDVPLRSANR
jgi:hypothetical protein